MSKRYITLAQLKRADACQGFRSLFAKFAPNGKIEVSDKTAASLGRLFGSRVDWAVGHLLTDKQRDEYYKRRDMMPPVTQLFKEAFAKANITLAPLFTPEYYQQVEARLLVSSALEAERQAANVLLFVDAYNGPKK